MCRFDLLSLSFVCFLIPVGSVYVVTFGLNIVDEVPDMSAIKSASPDGPVEFEK
jgi:hypothetical protein